jgi:hypothetical protein
MTAAYRFLCSALAALAMGVAGRAAEDALPKGSPFLPTGSAAAAAIAPGEMIEFAAVRTIGSLTEIDLYDTQGKKNHWIAVGASAEGMAVVSYDARRDQVVAKIGGMDKVLPLRKTKGNANGPAPIVTSAPAMSFATPLPSPVPAPMASSPTATAPGPVADNSSAGVGAPAPPATPPAAPTVPLTIARQEEEARMLVSDLLEIGMAQRKAYEEKQRQLADPNAAPPTPPPPVQPAPGGPPPGT